MTTPRTCFGSTLIIRRQRQLQRPGLPRAPVRQAPAFPRLLSPRVEAPALHSVTSRLDRSVLPTGIRCATRCQWHGAVEGESQRSSTRPLIGHSTLFLFLHELPYYLVFRFSGHSVVLSKQIISADGKTRSFQSISLHIVLNSLSKYL